MVSVRDSEVDGTGSNLWWKLFFSAIFFLSIIEWVEFNAFPNQVKAMLYQLCSANELFMNTPRHCHPY